MSLPTSWEFYGRWNQAVRDVIYSGAARGRAVYLDADTGALEAIGERAGFGNSDPETQLREAVRSTLRYDGATLPQLFSPHLMELAAWQKSLPRREAEQVTPPFLALLLLFVRAAERMARDGQFGQNNYYGRLAEELDLPEEQTVHYLGDRFRKAAPSLFGGLNRWLEANAGRYGLPTAYPLGAFEFVGLPIGQALIRDADRDALERHDGFFARYLTVGGSKREITEEELELALDEWFGEGHGSALLREAWHRARGALLEIVGGVFEGWTPHVHAESADTAITPSTIALSLRLKTVPITRVLFGLVVAYQDARAVEIDAKFMIGDRMLPAVLEPAVSDTHRAVNVGDVTLADILTNSVQLEVTDKVINRRPKALSPFRLDPVAGSFIEQPVGARGEPIAILAVESIAALLEPILSECAQEGWSRIDGTGSNGLPRGWNLYRHVVLVGRPAGELNADLEALFPSTGGGITLTGGLRLPGSGIGSSEFHASRPPSVVITPPDDTDVLVRIARTDLHGERRDDEHRLASGEVNILDAADLENRSGELSVELRRDNKSKTSIAQRRIRLRDADDPRTPISALSTRIAVALGSDGLLRVIDLDGEDAAGMSQVAQGALSLASIPAAMTQVHIAARPGMPEVNAEGTDEHGDTDGLDEGTSVGVALPNCLEKPGAHHMVLPRWDGSSPKLAVAGTCKHCGLHKIYRFRRAGKKSRVQSLAVRIARAAPPIAHSPNGDWTTAFDALCTVGQGSWRTFCGIVDLALPGVDPHTVVRRLFAEGHVDVEHAELDRDHGTWSVTPATLVPHPNGAFALVGFRSFSNVEALEALVDSAGGRFEVVGDPASALPQVFLSGLKAEELDEIITMISDDDEIPGQLTVDGAVAAELLEGLATLSEYSSLADAITIYPDATTAFFNVDAMKWEQEATIRAGGAIRHGRFGRVYAIALEQGYDRIRVRPGSYRVVKHLAAAAVGRTLLRWDPATAVMEAPLGAELPGLYERAVVLRTGTPPVAHRDGRVRYRNVDEPTFSRVSALIGN